MRFSFPALVKNLLKRSLSPSEDIFSMSAATAENCEWSFVHIFSKKEGMRNFILEYNFKSPSFFNLKDLWSKIWAQAKQFLLFNILEIDASIHVRIQLRSAEEERQRHSWEKCSSRWSSEKQTEINYLCCCTFKKIKKASKTFGNLCATSIPRFVLQISRTVLEVHFRIIKV